MNLGYLAMLGIVAACVLTFSYRFVHRRRYCSALESIGFAPYSGDQAALESALESVRSTRRVGGRPAQVRSPRRFKEGERSIFHCLSQYGRGKNGSDAFVFAIPRAGEKPESPITVFPNPTGKKSYSLLVSVARAVLKGHPLRIPAWLASTGISGAVSESGRDLAELLDPRDLQSLAHAGKCGFNWIVITREAVVLTVAEYHFRPREQLEFARQWIA